MNHYLSVMDDKSRQTIMWSNNGLTLLDEKEANPKPVTIQMPMKIDSANSILLKGEE